jgi:hypothetical protein
MCGGPTSAQENLQNEESQFYQTQINAYNQAYSQFSQISQQLQNMYAPILAKGPSQQGFSAGETEGLNAQAVQGTAANYAAASKALNEGIASEGGGNSNANITGAGANQLRENLAATGAAAESAEEEQIQQASYAQGYQEYEGAVGGEEQLAQGWNPNSFASSANNSASTANSEANAIAQEQNSIWTSVFGALGGIAGQAVGPAIQAWG